MLAELAAVIEARRGADGASYVAGMLAGPREQAQRKVGEEAVEVLLAEAGTPSSSPRWPTCGSTRWCCWRATE